jgi:hypothetical protein
LSAKVSLQHQSPRPRLIFKNRFMHFKFLTYSVETCYIYPYVCSVDSSFSFDTQKLYPGIYFCLDLFIHLFIYLFMTIKYPSPFLFMGCHLGKCAHICAHIYALVELLKKFLNFMQAQPTL